MHFDAFRKNMYDESLSKKCKNYTFKKILLQPLQLSTIYTFLNFKKKYMHLYIVKIHCSSQHRYIVLLWFKRYYYICVSIAALENPWSMGKIGQLHANLSFTMWSDVLSSLPWYISFLVFYDKNTFQWEIHAALQWFQRDCLWSACGQWRKLLKWWRTTHALAKKSQASQLTQSRSDTRMSYIFLKPLCD